MFVKVKRQAAPGLRRIEPIVHRQETTPAVNSVKVEGRAAPNMKAVVCCAALALSALTFATAASADDPNDPSMRSAAARAHDKAIIRDLNLRELDRVRARDARYQEGWEAYRQSRSASDPARDDYERDMARYRAERERHDREMAAWRDAVRRCEAGEWRYCDR